MIKPDPSKATPRPWRVCADSEQRVALESAADSQTQGRWTGRKIARLDNSLDARDANAALIVAAVNAYDAARELAQGIVDRWHAKDSNFEKQEPAEIEQAREVLKLMNETAETQTGD